MKTGKQKLLGFIPMLIIVVICSTCNNDTPQQSDGITATELVRDIKIGWNLGNSLDAIPDTPEHMQNWGHNPSVFQMETGWYNPVTTKENITAIKNAGFNAIRIPVSWSKAVDSNYTIRADWMRRVTEIVDYAVDNDLYIILNTHHDESIFKFRNADAEESKKAFGHIWEQIADNFRDFSEKLIFEALNEPRTVGSALEWYGGTPEEHKNLNDHYQVFVNVVRANGGVNATGRVLMVNTYGASGGEAAMNGLALPKDTVPNKLIVSVHSYAPVGFCFGGPVRTFNKNNPSDTGGITWSIDLAYEKFVSKGIPVIMGEFGSVDKNNEAERAEHAAFFVSYAKSKGIKCFWWDNGYYEPETGLDVFEIFNRRTNTVRFPQIVAALMNGDNTDGTNVNVNQRMNVTLTGHTADGGAVNFWQRGMATQEMNDDGFTARHPSLPIGLKLMAENIKNGQEIEITITGRIPASSDRIVDLSFEAWQALVD